MNLWIKPNVHHPRIGARFHSTSHDPPTASLSRYSFVTFLTANEQGRIAFAPVGGTKVLTSPDYLLRLEAGSRRRLPKSTSVPGVVSALALVIWRYPR